MNLNELRKDIDDIDDQMMELFKKRMMISEQIGKVKKVMGLPIFDPTREEIILNKRQTLLNDEALWPYYKTFLTNLFKLSKDVQNHD